MLGITAFPERLPGAVVPAGLVLVGIVFSRPFAVALATVWFRFPWREYLFISWAGLRGAVPIVLATIPVTAGMAGSHELFDIVFVVVVFLTLLQGPTLPWVAQWLGVVAAAEPRDLVVESAPMAEWEAELLQLRVPPGSGISGVGLFELRLPEGAAVTLIVRDRAGFVPAPTTLIRPDDHLLVVSTAQVRDATENRLRAVNRSGKLAAWHDDGHHESGSGM